MAINPAWTQFKCTLFALSPKHPVSEAKTIHDENEDARVWIKFTGDLVLLIGKLKVLANPYGRDVHRSEDHTYLLIQPLQHPEKTYTMIQGNNYVIQQAMIQT